MSEKKCSACITGSVFCSNGFPQNAACYGIDGIPLCINEAWCGRSYSQFGGKPPDHLVSVEKRGKSE